MLVQIDAVIVSCSCYAPNPSMAAMLVNKFGFRKDVLTFNLSGMGCSTSVVCVDMAKRLFKVLRLPMNPVVLPRLLSPLHSILLILSLSRQALACTGKSCMWDLAASVLLGNEDSWTSFSCMLRLRLIRMQQVVPCSVNVCTLQGPLSAWCLKPRRLPAGDAQHDMPDRQSREHHLELLHWPGPRLPAAGCHLPHGRCCSPDEQQVPT